MFGATIKQSFYKDLRLIVGRRGITQKFFDIVRDSDPYGFSNWLGG